MLTAPIKTCTWEFLGLCLKHLPAWLIKINGLFFFLTFSLTLQMSVHWKEMAEREQTENCEEI